MTHVDPLVDPANCTGCVVDAVDGMELSNGSFHRSLRCTKRRMVHMYVKRGHVCQTWKPHAAVSVRQPTTEELCCDLLYSRSACRRVGVSVFPISLTSHLSFFVVFPQRFFRWSIPSERVAHAAAAAAASSCCCEYELVGWLFDSLM